MTLGLPTGTVTLLFTDIEGSTRLMHELGERYAAVLAEHRRLLREAFRAHGGVEVDTQGDAFFYAFAGAPDAVAAAGAAQQALSGGPVSVRIGVHTGEPALTAEGYVGVDVHRAARIMGAGHGGQVLLSRATREALDADLPLRDLGEHRLKDFDDPVWLFQLGEEEFPPLRTLAATNLPSPTSSFIGRERELEELVALLRARHRLITLTGAGGSGKTRLALEAASELVGDYPNGTYWIPLAELRDPALVMETIAQSVGARDELTAHFAGKHALLLLDNFEQVVEAARPLAELLSACPGLDCLVTSRELLRIAGEREFAVPPLADPEAVELFRERSGLRRDDAIAELCRRLDKLPLAIELAAARTSALSPAQILERLASRLDLLKGGRDAEARHATLRSTIAWSYELLDDAEQRLFACLSIFSGGCTLEAAEEIAGAQVDTLQSLVEKSLVRHTDERFWMLETIREFASELLVAGGEAESMRKRHASYFLKLVEGLEPSFLGPEEGHALELLRTEHDNFRAALRSTLDTGDVDSTLRLATGGLQRFWRIHGHQSEGRRWLEEALGKGGCEPRLRAQGLRALANIAGQLGDTQAAVMAANEALSFFRAHGEVAFAIDCLNALGAFAMRSGDARQSRRYFEEVEQLARASHDTFRLSAAVNNLGNVALYEGAYERAQRLFEESLELSRGLELDEAVANSLANAGQAAFLLGQYDRAGAMLRESIEVSLRISDVVGIIYALECLGAVLAEQAQWEAAVKLLAGAETINEAIRLHVEPLEQKMHDRAVDLARSGLGDERFDAAWTAGRRMTQDDVISVALGKPQTESSESRLAQTGSPSSSS